MLLFVSCWWIRGVHVSSTLKDHGLLYHPFHRRENVPIIIYCWKFTVHEVSNCSIHFFLPHVSQTLIHCSHLSVDSRGHSSDCGVLCYCERDRWKKNRWCLTSQNCLRYWFGTLCETAALRIDPTMLRWCFAPLIILLNYVVLPTSDDRVIDTRLVNRDRSDKFRLVSRQPD